MQERISTDDVKRIKEEHIKNNLLYKPITVAEILSISVSQVFALVDEGKLEKVNEAEANGRQATRGTRITAVSVEKYVKSIRVR